MVQIQKEVKEGRKCWICGKKADQLEAHEFWEYDKENRIQKLKAIHHSVGCAIKSNTLDSGLKPLEG